MLGKLQVELDRMKAEEERVRKLCGDSGMPPVQLLGTVVGTLLAERRATALLVGELVRVQEAVVELSARIKLSRRFYTAAFSPCTRLTG